MWRVVISVAQQIPWRRPGQTRLVELIQALKDLPEPMMVDSGSWGELAIWWDLPVLGPVMTECGHGMRLGFIFSWLFCVWSIISIIGIVTAIDLEDTSAGPKSYSHPPTQLRSILSTSHAERYRWPCWAFFHLRFPRGLRGRAWQTCQCISQTRPSTGCICALSSIMDLPLREYYLCTLS